MALLDVCGVVSGYDSELDILSDVSLRVESGQMVSIIGPNGAGKSTLLKAIFGLLRVSRGSVRLGGKDLVGLRPDEVLQEGVCFVPQGRNVFTEMTVEENLELGGFIRTDRQELLSDINAIYEMFPVLHERRRQRAGHLSGGEQQMLEMGRALLLKPRLVLLDEPSMGLSPKMAESVFHHVAQIKDQGVAVLIVEQNADASLRMSDHAYVLEMGRNRLDGPADALLHDETVRAAYLGL